MAELIRFKFPMAGACPKCGKPIRGELFCDGKCGIIKPVMGEECVICKGWGYKDNCLNDPNDDRHCGVHGDGMAPCRRQ